MEVRNKLTLTRVIAAAVLCLIFCSYANGAEPESADAIRSAWKILPAIKSDAVVLWSLLEIANLEARAGRKTESRDSAKSAWKKLELMPRHIRDLHLPTALDKLAEMGDAPLVIEILMGIPTEERVSALAYLSIEAGNWSSEDAILLLDTLRHEFDEKPTPLLRRSISGLYVQLGRLDEALRFYREEYSGNGGNAEDSLEQSFDRLTAIVELTAAYAARREYAAATDIAKMAPSSADRESGLLRLAITAIENARHHADDLEVVLNIYELMKPGPRRDQVVQRLVPLLASRHEFARARQLVNTTANGEMRGAAIAQLAEANAKLGRTTEAEALLSESLDHIEDETHRAQTQRTIAVALVVAGRIPAARRLLAEIQGLEDRSLVHEEIALHMVRNGRPYEAKMEYHVALSLLTRETTLTTSSQRLREFSQRSFARGEQTLGLAALKLAYIQASPATDSIDGHLWGELMEIAKLAAQYQSPCEAAPIFRAAAKVARHFADENYTAMIYQRIAAAQTTSGGKAAVRAWAENEAVTTYRVGIYLGLAEGIQSIPHSEPVVVPLRAIESRTCRTRRLGRWKVGTRLSACYRTRHGWGR